MGPVFVARRGQAHRVGADYALAGWVSGEGGRRVVAHPCSEPAAANMWWQTEDRPNPFELIEQIIRKGDLIKGVGKPRKDNERPEQNHGLGVVRPLAG